MAGKRVCAHCGKPLGRNKSPQAKYCSDSCRVLACRQRKAKGIKPKPKARPEKKPAPVIDKREFDRMMDGSIEDELRHVRDRLKAYLDDPDTPANAMPNIASKYLAVCERLHDMAGGDPLLALADEEAQDDPADATAAAGAAIV